MLAELFESFTGLERIYLYCAIIGGMLFVVRLVLQFVGGDLGDSDVDVDMEMDVDVDIDGIDGDMDVHGDTDVSFKLLSFQAITAFFMMFGLVGLAVAKQGNLGATWSLFGAVAGGLVTVWIMKIIFEAAMKLQSSGTLDLKKNAIGQEGTVYLTIPADGPGKVRVAVQNHLKVFNARTKDGQEIKTGEEIKVVNVVSGNILVVSKLS